MLPLACRFSPCRKRGACVAFPLARKRRASSRRATTASLAGIPLGSGVWVIDIASDQYTAVASGRTSGLVKLVSDGSGSGGSRGTVHGASMVPTSYASSTTTDKKTDEVRMTLRAGAVKDVSAEPPLPPSPDRVPVTEAHRKGVTDPMSAAIIAVPGTGEVLTPDACKRKLAVFDGRQRADIELVFKRMDRVKADNGYQGPVVVCTMLYRPIAGHRPERPAIKYLIEQRDMEMWLAPIAGTRALVPFRFSVPTPFGLGVLQATYFVAQPQPAQVLRQSPGQREDAVALLSSRATEGRPGIHPSALRAGACGASLDPGSRYARPG